GDKSIVPDIQKQLSTCYSVQSTLQNPNYSTCSNGQDLEMQKIRTNLLGKLLTKCCHQHRTTRNYLENSFIENLFYSSMDWASAQLHCRNLHSDLARVRNQEENKHLQKMVNRQRVWIGMMRATWRWSDGSEASFLPWKPLHPTPGGNCGVLDVNNLGMTDRSCAEKHPFFCYSSK
uniref:C-type lectin domain-containing protein n=1 Tax=Amphiprion percula TaxID=161767 RepID=A0A3P8TDK6_AMPPE